MSHVPEYVPFSEEMWSIQDDPVASKKLFEIRTSSTKTGDIELNGVVYRISPVRSFSQFLRDTRKEKGREVE